MRANTERGNWRKKYCADTNRKRGRARGHAGGGTRRHTRMQTVSRRGSRRACAHTQRGGMGREGGGEGESERYNQRQSGGSEASEKTKRTCVHASGGGGEGGKRGGEEACPHAVSKEGTQKSMRAHKQGGLKVARKRARILAKRGRGGRMRESMRSYTQEGGERESMQQYRPRVRGQWRGGRWGGGERESTHA